MKVGVGLGLAAVVALGASPARAHDDDGHVTPGSYNILATAPADIVGRAVLRGVQHHPEYATNCTFTIRSSRTSAVGTCYNWSGSGNYKFQLAVLLTNCTRTMWWYGNVGFPYIRGKTSTGKWSYAYAPAGGWRIAYAKVLVWKP
jgi:hypothetical protein